MSPSLPGPLRKNGRRIVGTLGRAARRLPDPVKTTGRNIFDVLPESDLKRRVSRILHGAAAGKTPSAFRTGRYGAFVPLVAPDSTYTEGQASTYLQLEAAHLRRRLFALESAAGTGDLAWGEGSDEAKALVDEYLAGASTEERAAGTHLVVVNVYPSVGNEYGNGFVHRRIKYYLETGANIHVAVVGPDVDPSVYDYDGVRVLTGAGDEVRELLRRFRYRSVSTHFMGRYIWDQIKSDLAGQTYYCFMHGFESRRWVRTLYNYRGPQQVDQAIGDTLDRQALWREVLAHPSGPVKFVFVSDWWRRASQEDMELVYPAARTEIIHNVIETKLFRYVPKPPEQRFKLLWIRSASNLNYGSDIAVAVLQRLRETEYWDRLDVRIIGDGRHFGEFEAAFQDDPQIKVERRFASQSEIAEIHRDYGIFLVPSRLDSQGVSRDEAMSSGLVPVTNAVSAIPEFVDSDCGIIAPQEDVNVMVAGLLRLFGDPELYSRMSEAAVQRVTRQSGPAATIDKEMCMLGMIDSPVAESSRGSAA